MAGPHVDESRDELVGRIRLRMDGLWRAFSNTVNGGTTETLAPGALEDGRVSADVRRHINDMMRQVSQIQRSFERSLSGTPPLADVFKEFATFREMYKGILSEDTQSELREVEQHLRSLVAVQTLKAQGRLGIDIPVSTFHDLQARIDDAVRDAKMPDIEKEKPRTPEALHLMREALDELKTSMHDLNRYLHGSDQDSYSRRADNAAEQMATIGRHLQTIHGLKDLVFADPAYAASAPAMKQFEEAMRDMRKVIEDMGPEIRKLSLIPASYDQTSPRPLREAREI